MSFQNNEVISILQSENYSLATTFFHFSVLKRIPNFTKSSIFISIQKLANFKSSSMKIFNKKVKTFISGKI